MAQYYRTAAGPKYIEGGIYAPPVEMMQNAIGLRDKQLDELMTTNAMLQQEGLKLSALDFDRDTLNAFQKGLEDETNSFSDTIYKDPLGYRKHLAAMRAMSAKYAKELREGNMSHVTARAQAYQKWLEDNAKLKETDPDLYNKLAMYHYEDLKKRTSLNPAARFSAGAGIGRPNLEAKFKDVFGKIVSNKDTRFMDGKQQWMVDHEWVDRERVQQIAWNLLLQDPNFNGYTKQMHMLGDKGYMDDNGLIAPIITVDENGKRVTDGDRENMTLEQLSKLRTVINPESAYYHDLSLPTNVFSFDKRKADANPYALASHKHGLNMQRLAYDWQKKDAAQREEDLGFYKKACANSSGYYSWQCQLYRSMVTTDGMVGTTGNPQSFDGILDALGVGENVFFRNTSNTDQFPAESAYLQAVIEELDKEYLGKTLTLNYKKGIKNADGTLKIENGGIVEEDAVQKIDAMLFLNYMNMGKNPKHTINEFLKMYGIPGIVTHNYYDANSNMNKRYTEESKAYTLLKNIFEGYKNEAEKRYNSKTAFIKEAEQTPTFSVNNHNVQMDAINFLSSNLEYFIIQDKRGDVIEDKGDLKKMVALALNTGDVDWKAIGLKDVPKDTNGSLPMLHMLPYNKAGSVGLSFNWGNGAILNFVPIRDNSAINNKVINLGLQGTNWNSDFRLLATDYHKGHIGSQLQNSNGLPIITHVGNRNMAFKREPNGDYTAYYVNSNNKLGDKFATKGDLNALIGGILESQKKQ